jgi:hypothetical protein
MYFLVGRPLLYLTWISGLFVLLAGIVYLTEQQWLPGLLAPLGLAMVVGGFYFGVIRPEGEFRRWRRETAVHTVTGLGVIFTFFGAVFAWSRDWWGLVAVAVGLPLFAIGMYYGLFNRYRQ